MGDVLYMGMKNDVSFIIADTISIYEQQSTFNPNMPLRGLMYAARLYDKYVHVNKLNIYGSSLVPLPVPKLVVFYNGVQDKADGILELKDAFQADPYDTADISVRVRMLNINYGQNNGLLKGCRPLSEYAWLIQRIREYGKDMDIEAAVDLAIDEMPAGYEIRPFLAGNRAEVKQMCITEYNEMETMQMFKEQGRREGIGIGAQNKASEIAASMLLADEPVDKVISYTGLDRAAIHALARELRISPRGTGQDEHVNEP